MACVELSQTQSEPSKGSETFVFAGAKKFNFFLCFRTISRLFERAIFAMLNITTEASKEIHSSIDPHVSHAWKSIKEKREMPVSHRLWQSYGG